MFYCYYEWYQESLQVTKQDTMSDTWFSFPSLPLIVTFLLVCFGPTFHYFSEDALCSSWLYSSVSLVFTNLLYYFFHCQHQLITTGMQRCIRLLTNVANPRSNLIQFEEACSFLCLGDGWAISLLKTPVTCDPFSTRNDTRVQTFWFFWCSRVCPRDGDVPWIDHIVIQ